MILHTYIHTIFILRLIIKFQGALQKGLNLHLTLQTYITENKQKYIKPAMLHSRKKV